MIFLWVLPYTDMNQPQVYMCPPSRTPLPPPSPSHLSRLSQCTDFECPVSCIKLGLVIYFFSLSCIGEGNGNPLQCSCLENPRDGGAWWAAVYGVAQSWTRLKRLSSSSNIYVSVLFSNHPTLVFSHRVQKSFLSICVSCCFAYRVIVTIFLNSIYMC